MSVPAPMPEECQGLQFKTLCRLRVFGGQPGLFSGAASLVAAAPSFGLIFVGTPSGFQVLQSNKISEIEAPRGETLEYPRREITLGSLPSHLSVSCDENLLGVALVQDGCPYAIIYSIASMCSRNIIITTNIRLASSPGNKVLDFQFNPGLPQFLAACTSDGGVGIYELKGNSFEVSTLPPAVHATCLCWSPKGKQLVVGDSKGNISQYKPDLKLVKSYPPPPDKPAAALVNLLWISNYQFAAVYADTANPSERPGIIIVNVPKSGTTYVNYEDICYSAGELRPPQFYLTLQAKWNIMMVGSANSMEVGVLAMAQDHWVQWTQEDAARAELPLTSSKQETFPVGLALDTSSTRQLPWGENNCLQPMPMLHILSHEGVLCIFHVINILPQAVPVCEPPRPLPDMSGLDQFVTGPAVQAPHTQSQPVEPVSQPSQATQLFQPPASSHTTQAPQMSNLFQPSPAQTASNFQQPSAGNPLAQLASMNNQLQTKPTGLGGLSIGGLGFGATQSQPAFSLSGTATSSQAPAVSSTSGTLTPKTTSSAFSTSVSQPPQQLTPPPSYSTPPQLTSTPKAVVPEQTQRPAVVVPVPALHNTPATATSPHASEGGAIAGAGDAAEDKIETVDPTVYVKCIEEEVHVFEKEMDSLKRLVTKEIPPIGSDEDKKTLLRMTENLDSVITELNKSVGSLKIDFYDVKSIVLEALLWVADTKSRLRQFHKPSYLQLVKAQELDPVTSRTLFNIQQKFDYIEIQLSNISKKLSLEWIQHQDTKSPRNRLYVPTMDEILQTMVKQNSIIHRLQMILDDISKRITTRKLKNSTRIPLISDSALAKKSTSRCLNLYENESTVKSDIDLSSLAENLLEPELKKTQSDDLNLESLAARALNLNDKGMTIYPTQKRLSKKKEDMLRELLLQLPMARIKADRALPEAGLHRPYVRFSSSVLSISPRKASLQTEKGPEGSTLTESPSTSTPSLSGFASQNKADSKSSLVAGSTGVPQTTKPSATLAFSTSPSPNTSSGGTKQATLPAPFVTPAGSTGFSSSVPKVTTVKEAPKPFSTNAPNLFAIGGTKQATAPASSTTSAGSIGFFSSTPNVTTAKEAAKPAPAGASNLFAIGGTKQTTVPAFSATPAGATGSSSSRFSFTDPGSTPASILQALATPQATTEKEAPKPFSTGAPNLFAIGGTKQSTVAASSAASAGSAAASPSRFSFTDPGSTPGSILEALVAPSSPSALNLAKGTSLSSATPPTTSFGQTVSSSMQTLSFATPTPLGSATLKIPTPSGASKGSDSLSALSDMVSKAGVSAAGDVKMPPLAAKPASPVHPTAASSSSPIIVVGTSPSSKAGLLPTPTNMSSIQSKLGSGVTITPVTATSSSAPPTTPATSSLAAAADSTTTTTTSFFGAMGIGGSPVATNKPGTSFFGGSGGSGFQLGKGASIFGSPPASSTSDAKPAAAATTPSISFSAFAPQATAASATPTTAAEATTASSSASASTTALPQTSTIAASTTSPFAASSAASSFFGTSSTTPSATVFGQAASPPAASSAASPVVAASATSSPFGGTSVSTTKSIFGGATTAGSTTGTLFGETATAGFSFALSSISAATTNTTTTATSPATTTTTASAAGGATGAPFGTSGFSFALPSISTTASSTASTTAAATTPVKAFSFATPATTSAGSLFGGSSGSLFGQTPTTGSTPASFFGQAICSPTSSSSSIFGGGSSTVSSATTASPFGQSATASAFGAKPAMGQLGGSPSPFGQSGSSAFGSSKGSVFGGASSGGSLFGGTATSPSGGNLFQQAASTTGSMFGQAASSAPSGAFSGGMGGTVEQAGFGSPSSFQSRPSGFGAFQSPTTGFGSAPSFGGSPAFGAAPAFGATPAFGAAPAFGSPPRSFSGASPAAFGTASPTQTNSTFEALAAQDSGPTFGNLAQGGGQSAQPTNLFGTAPTQAPFSTSSSFGGSSFSSWR